MLDRIEKVVGLDFTATYEVWVDGFWGIETWKPIDYTDE